MWSEVPWDVKAPHELTLNMGQPGCLDEQFATSIVGRALLLITPRREMSLVPSIICKANRKWTRWCRYILQLGDDEAATTVFSLHDRDFLDSIIKLCTDIRARNRCVIPSKYVTV